MAESERQRSGFLRVSASGSPVAYLASLALGALLLAAGAGVASADDTPAPVAPKEYKSLGVLNAETWEKGKGIVPDEFLERYKNGLWSHEIIEPPEGTIFYDADFIGAGNENRGRYDIGANGQVVSVDTRQQPPFIYGPPFPDIDPADPKVGAKVVWNFFYQSYVLGNSRNHVNLDWVGSRGMERRLATDVFQRFFDGQPAKYRPAANPQNFLFQQISAVTQPADVQGTVALTHRFRDPAKRDQVWTFVPALRRVRAVSPANRSDGFLGSDMSQDDGSYFDGKPEDFNWRLVGEGEMLVFYDRTAMLEQRHEIQPLPDGGFEARDLGWPRFAYQEEDFTGFAWAPLSDRVVLVRRPVWIVEGVPHDKYYLYGRIVLRFDKQSWRGSYSSKYDWQGNILNSYLPMYGPFFEIDGEWRSYAYVTFTMSQNWKLDRATVSYADPAKPKSQSRVAYTDNFFNVDQLSRLGK